MRDIPTSASNRLLFCLLNSIITLQNGVFYSHVTATALYVDKQLKQFIGTISLLLTCCIDDEDGP